MNGKLNGIFLLRATKDIVVASPPKFCGGRRNNRWQGVLISVLSLFLLFSFLLIGTGCQGKVSSEREVSTAKTLYQCSMHPTIVSEKPDNCPICGMRLERVEQGPKILPKASSGKGKILYYRHPMKPEITSSQPGKDEMGMDYIPVYESEEVGGGMVTIPGHAEIFISPERQQWIGVKTWVVEERPLLTSIRAVGRVAYDSELYNLFNEYEEAVRAFEKIKSSPLPEVRERAHALLQGTQLKLKLRGISDSQIQEFLKSDQHRTDLLLPSDTAWVYADVYEYQANLVKPGQTAKITVPALPGEHFEGKVKTVDAILNAMSRTLKVRIEVPNKEALLKAEMFVDVFLEVPLGEKLAIPESALLDTGSTQLVFVAKGNGHIEPRAIRIGYEADGYYEVLSGLSKGERVVSSANFLIDSESRLRAAIQGFGGSKKEETKDNKM